LIKAGGRTIHSEIHKLINSLWNKGELRDEWNESIILPIYKKGNKADCSNYEGISLSSNYIQNFIQHPAVKVKTICAGNYWGPSVLILTQQINYW